MVLYSSLKDSAASEELIKQGEALPQVLLIYRLAWQQHLSNRDNDGDALDQSEAFPSQDLNIKYSRRVRAR